MEKLKIVVIDQQYCNFLREFENKVPDNSKMKSNRPFIGVLFKVGEYNYFAPLSSPKTKHLGMESMLDFMKIDNGELGVINFNNMIPVIEGTYFLADLDGRDIKNKKYVKLLNEQYLWLLSRQNQVRRNAFNLYKYYNQDRLDSKMKARCCNFKLLEKKSREYQIKFLSK